MNLRDETEAHWVKKEDKYQHYIHTLLPKEIKYARDNDPTRLPQHTCKQLVLLVGHMWEPLFQSIWVYRPTEVILVLSEEYGSVDGDTIGNELKALIENELANELGNTVRLTAKPLPPIKDTSKATFQTLLANVKRDDSVEKTNTVWPLIIDITGAKKSMVAGAFLFAAYADVPISYVNFDDEAYNTDYNRPYGYACRIEEVDNPYQLFALRDWERVRTLYDEYNFREARLILAGEHGEGGENAILNWSIKNYFPGEVLENIKSLWKILWCYELWDNGDFRVAHLRTTEIRKEISNFQPPSTVEILGEKWLCIEDDDLRDKTINLYVSSSAGLELYVLDELLRIRRLIQFKQDYRSAFVRAGGLNEILLVTRFVNRLSEEQRRNVVEKMSAGKLLPNAKTLFEILQKDEKNVYKWQKIELKFVNKAMNNWWANIILLGQEADWQKFLNIRNQLAHSFVSVSKLYAEQAWVFVGLNFVDFLGRKLPELEESASELQSFERMMSKLDSFLNAFAKSQSFMGKTTWSNLCELCSLSQYLPINPHHGNGKE